MKNKKVVKEEGIMKKRKEVKKVMMTNSEAKSAIAKYMEEQNRPYSIQNL